MRLSMAPFCPSAIADMMVRYWSVNPDAPPCFSNIEETLRNTMEPFKNVHRYENAVSSLNDIHYSTIIFDTKTSKEQFAAIQPSNSYYKNLKLCLFEMVINIQKLFKQHIPP